MTENTPTTPISSARTYQVKFSPRTYMWLGGVIGYWVGKHYDVKLPFVKKVVNNDV